MADALQEKSEKLLIEAGPSVVKIRKSDKSAVEKCGSGVWRTIYITNWITKYNSNFFLADLIAGITLGLTMIPQSIAYASLAGLAPNYGLYSAFIGSYIYVLFGSVRQVSIGPTSLMALLVLPATYGKPIEYVFILAFIAGCIELLFGVFQLGFIVDFIPIPVTSAFTSATAMAIILSQIKSVTGASYLGTSFSTYLIGFFQHLGEIKLADTVLGVSCIVILLFLRKVQEIPISDSNSNKAVIKKILWYISISRNALVVFSSAVFAFYLSDNGQSTVPFRLSRTVVAGLPDFAFPSFTVPAQNGTNEISFMEIVSDLNISLIFIPLVAILANVSIAKAFAAGSTVNASQEMIALGLCNIFGSFVQAMPTCGAFTRSAVSEASGVRTPFAGIYSGTMTILALNYLTGYFYFIPRATLGAILITAVYFMIDFKIVKSLWNQSRKDFWIWTISFVSCLSFGVDVGLLIGSFSNLMVLMFYWARPKLTATIRNIEGKSYIHVCLSLGLMYPGIDHVRDYLNQVGRQNADIEKILLDCSGWSNMDYTSLKGIENIVVDFKTRSQQLLLINVPKHIEGFLLNSTKIKYCTDMDDLRTFILDLE